MKYIYVNSIQKTMQHPLSLTGVYLVSWADDELERYFCAVIISILSNAEIVANCLGMSVSKVRVVSTRIDPWVGLELLAG